MSAPARRSVRLEDRYLLRDGEVYLSGLQALVRLPLEQHRLDQRNGLDTSVFVSGYEGSPLAGYDLELSRQRELLDQHNVVFKPSVNEELGANAVQGSQLAFANTMTTDGVVGIWYGKAPGLDRATDALRHGNLGGAAPNGGVLVLVGDDSIAKSSTVPSGSERALAEIGMTVLSPADPQDVLELGLHGIALSRFCGLWTGFKLATNVVDGAATVRVRTDQVEPVFPDATIDGAPYRHSVTAHFVQPTLSQLERSLVGERRELALRYARANGLNTVEGDPAAKVGIIAAGVAYRDVRDALGSLGIGAGEMPAGGVRLLKLGMVSPLEPTILREFAAGLDEIIVVEEKQAFLELAVKDLLYGTDGAPKISGKRDPDGRALLRADGDLPPHVIAAALRRRFAAHPGAVQTVAAASGPAAGGLSRTPLPLVTRTPYFCSGCPHNLSTAAPEGSLVGAGIGCSGLAAFMPAERVGTVIGLCQMGGEGAAWIGMAPFVEADHLIQNIGDGTFHHSGSLALRAAVAAGVNITYKLLYNDAVAMTGGQEAVGRMSVPQLVSALLAEGVAKVVITTEDTGRYRRVRLPRGVQVRPREQLLKIQEDLALVPGVTVLIHDQECATELRRKRKRQRIAEPDQRVFINERVCEGCGDCGAKSNCLSVQPVETEFGRKTQIHQASCNKDFSCLEGDCPAFLTVKPGSAGPREKSIGTLTGQELPDPPRELLHDEVNLRITGIGGTGVVTAAQVIATAATVDGLYVRGLDQMGMAQKGGAVVSDVRISRDPIEGTNKLEPDQCDLYLGCDILVAGEEKNLAAASSERTLSVLSTTRVPTGAMVASVEVGFPDVDEIVARIGEVSRRPPQAVDARGLSVALFGDDQYANILLIGVAAQAGALPFGCGAFEKALELNGVAVERNVQAFRRGRQLVADPAGFERVLPASARPRPPESPAVPSLAGLVGAPEGSELARLVRHRVAELIAYQDAGYAERYARAVERVRAAEERTGVDRLLVSEAYARNLYKLMAYKDEYEVARLSLDPGVAQDVKATFGDAARFSYRLHPPVLRALGMNRKITLGPWFRTVFQVLYAMRRLRGTRWDPFGMAKVRRLERSLITEYTGVVDGCLTGLTAENQDLVRQIAELPDGIRGYEEVKLRNVEAYRSTSSELVERLRAEGRSGPAGRRSATG